MDRISLIEHTDDPLASLEVIVGENEIEWGEVSTDVVTVGVGHDHAVLVTSLYEGNISESRTHDVPANLGVVVILLDTEAVQHLLERGKAMVGTEQTYKMVRGILFVPSEELGKIQG